VSRKEKSRSRSLSADDQEDDLGIKSSQSFSVESGSEEQEESKDQISFSDNKTSKAVTSIRSQIVASHTKNKVLF
jgi:hypothetical protein